MITSTSKRNPALGSVVLSAIVGMSFAFGPTPALWAAEPAGQAPLTAETAETTEAADASPSSGGRPTAGGQAGRSRSRPSKDFDAKALAEVGLDRAEIDRLETAWNRVLATGNSLDGSEEALHEELGDQGFDGLLFAIGAPNRLIVDRMMSAGGVAQAGLLSGDQLLLYNCVRILTHRQLSKQVSAHLMSRKRIPVVALRGEQLLGAELKSGWGFGVHWSPVVRPPLPIDPSEGCEPVPLPRNRGRKK